MRQFNLQTGVIVLIDSIGRDKQLYTADSVDFPEAINLSHVRFLKVTVRQSIQTAISYHKY
jgi:hypothetical protein